MLGLALVAVLTGCGFRAAGPMAVEVTIRNVSPGPVTVQISAAPSGSRIYSIEPWRRGTCFFHTAFDPGHIEIRVSGSNVEAERKYSAEVPANRPPVKVGVQIFTNGNVQFGGAFPQDVLPCVGHGF